MAQIAGSVQLSRLPFQPVFDPGGRGSDPLALDAAGQSHEGLRPRPGGASRDVEGEQQLARAHAALPRQERPVPGSQDEPRRTALATPGQPVRESGPEGPPQGDVVRLDGWRVPEAKRVAGPGSPGTSLPAAPRRPR